MGLISGDNQAADGLKSLFDRKMVGINEYLSLKEERLRQFHGLQSEKLPSVRLTLGLYSMKKQFEANKAQSLSGALNELDGFRQCEGIAQKLTKAKNLGRKQILRRSKVQRVWWRSVAMVEPTQVLMEPVPVAEALEVEAFVSVDLLPFHHKYAWSKN